MCGARAVSLMGLHSAATLPPCALNDLRKHTCCRPVLVDLPLSQLAYKHFQFQILMRCQYHKLEMLTVQQCPVCYDKLLVAMTTAVSQVFSTRAIRSRVPRESLCKLHSFIHTTHLPRHFQEHLVFSG